MSSAISKHLWEIDHPYYCSETNFYAPASDTYIHYSRWQDFYDAERDSDLDMNLVFRFDWKVPHVDGDPENAIEWQGDENYRDGTLKLFIMGQRKGLYRCVEVDVCRADEPRVIEYLRPRWEQMQKLWEPFSWFA